MKHFFNEIQDDLKDPNTFDCHFCTYKASHLQNIILHVGVKHEVIKKFIPLHLHIKRMRMKESSENESMEKASPHSGHSIQTLKNPPCKQCYLCQETYKNRTALYQHIAYKHFKDQLKGFVIKVDSGFKCCVCDNVKTTMCEILGHLGCVHSLVENYMPAEQRIDKSKGGRKGKTPERSLDEKKFQDPIVEKLTETEEIAPVKKQEIKEEGEYFEEYFSSEEELTKDFKDNKIHPLLAIESLDISQSNKKQTSWILHSDTRR